MARTTQKGWVKCPRGELQRLGERLRTRHLRALWVKTALVVVCSAGVVFGAIQVGSAIVTGSSYGSNYSGGFGGRGCHDDDDEAPAATVDCLPPKNQ